jgi:hypothetical protein
MRRSRRSKEDYLRAKCWRKGDFIKEFGIDPHHTYLVSNHKLFRILRFYMRCIKDQSGRKMTRFKFLAKSVRLG